MVSLQPLSSQSTREALLEETAAGPAVGPCCCSTATRPVHTAVCGPAEPAAFLPCWGCWGWLSPSPSWSSPDVRAKVRGPVCTRRGCIGLREAGSGPVPLDGVAAAITWNEAEQPLTAGTLGGTRKAGRGPGGDWPATCGPMARGFTLPLCMVGGSVFPAGCRKDQGNSRSSPVGRRIKGDWVSLRELGGSGDQK